MKFRWNRKSNLVRLVPLCIWILVVCIVLVQNSEAQSSEVFAFRKHSVGGNYSPGKLPDTRVIYKYQVNPYSAVEITGMATLVSNLSTAEKDFFSEYTLGAGYQRALYEYRMWDLPFYLFWNVQYDYLYFLGKNINYGRFVFANLSRSEQNYSRIVGQQHMWIPQLSLQLPIKYIRLELAGGYRLYYRNFRYDQRREVQVKTDLDFRLKFFVQFGKLVF